jgi:hypothetical protein
LQILRLPQAMSGGDRAPLDPAGHLSYHASDRIPARLANQGVAAVAYLIDGERVATVTQAPFTRQLKIPSNILNGHAFELSTRVEFTSGQVADSLPRRLLLQAQNSVGNAFDVLLSFDEHSWSPAPLKLSAQIVGSSQAISEVEFLMAQAADGPWEQLDQQFGPPYEISLNIDVGYSGYYLKARAIDAFGNTVESAPKQFFRHLDTAGPVAQLSLVGNEVDTLNNNVVLDYPFTVQATLDDEGSGIARALLKRDGVVVAAAFANGVLEYVDTAQAVTPINYTLEMTDLAGNTGSAGLTANVVTDSGPSIQAVIAPVDVREQSSFEVQVSASDDLQIAAVEFD